MREEFIEGIYAGWLAKIIGIRLGAPIEGWPYEKIKNIYGELTGYPVDYREFAADDDSNGPLFFLRALEDSGHGSELKAQDVADALLNYAPFEHGFFWWGGYGVSTEHTAYLNLKNGIPAPRSGSIEQNGKTVAEQIGGQIFIDTWGLVAAGNPDLAAKLAKEAASVTHDGNGVYGGIFVAVCISYAFIEKDIRKIIAKGLSYIPQDCEYTRVVKAVMNFYDQYKDLGWRECFAYIHENFGYDKYPGICHIIPNIAVMILSLLYGNGNFSDTLNICNMCGWDTDCNVGNVATIMGVRNGLKDIDYEQWRKPINDFLACSSVVGSMNIMDIPYGALYIAKLAYRMTGEKMPKPWADLAQSRMDSCHFEFPGSTHAMRVKVEDFDGRVKKVRECCLRNTEETAFTGRRSLRFCAKPLDPGDNLYIFKKTYYTPSDFHDSRYDPSFSPIVYPGQTIRGSAYIPEDSQEVWVSLYAKEARSGRIYYGDKTYLSWKKWQELSFCIPCIEGGLIEEIGFCFYMNTSHPQGESFTALIDDLYVDGNPCYSVDFSNEKEEVWTIFHREISQFTKLKGLVYLEEQQLHLACSDFGEVYTGHYRWDDYKADFYITPVIGQNHYMNVRVQGASRSYAVGFLAGGQVAVLKKEKDYQKKICADFLWENQREYKVSVTVSGNCIRVIIDNILQMEYIDNDDPYICGGVGIGVENGSHISCRKIVIS